jgi:hypothetical protein
MGRTAAPYLRAGGLCLALAAALAACASCVPRQYQVTRAYEETAYRAETVRETYTENETTTETVTGQYELSPLYTWYSNGIEFNLESNVWYAAYDIPQEPAYDNLRFRLSIWKQLQNEPASLRVLDMTRGGQLTPPTASQTQDYTEGLFPWTWIKSPGQSVEWTWLDQANRQIAQSLFIGGRSYLWSKQEDPQVLDLNAGRAKKIAVIICGPEYRWNTRVTALVEWSRTTSISTPVARQRTVEKQVPYQVTRQKTVTETRQVPFWEAVLQP